MVLYRCLGIPKTSYPTNIILAILMQLAVVLRTEQFDIWKKMLALWQLAVELKTALASTCKIDIALDTCVEKHAEHQLGTCCMLCVAMWHALGYALQISTLSRR
jgi:hypothetical protein